MYSLPILLMMVLKLIMMIMSSFDDDDYHLMMIKTTRIAEVQNLIPRLDRNLSRSTLTNYDKDGHEDGHDS